MRVESGERDANTDHRDHRSPGRPACRALLLAKAAADDDRQRLRWALERTQAEAQPARPSLEELARLAGTYGNARVWLEGGQLRYQRPTRPTVLLTPLTRTVFATDLDDPLRLEFVQAADGRVDRLVVLGEGFTREQLAVAR